MYFKITNKDEIHNKLQYHDGIVEDILPFNDNPEDSCCEGGIYFSDEKNIFRFCEYGQWIRQVEIPEGAKFIKDPSGTKWRANKLFFHPRKEFFTVEMFQWLIEQGADINVGNAYLLNFCVHKNLVELIKLLIKNGINVHAKNGRALRTSLMLKRFDITKILIDEHKKFHLLDKNILFLLARLNCLDMLKTVSANGADIHVDNGRLVRYCAFYGHLEMLKYLIEVGVKFNGKASYINSFHGKTALDWAKERGFTDIIDYLESLNAK